MRSTEYAGCDIPFSSSLPLLSFLSLAVNAVLFPLFFRPTPPDGVRWYHCFPLSRVYDLPGQDYQGRITGVGVVTADRISRVGLNRAGLLRTGLLRTGLLRTGLSRVDRIDWCMWFNCVYTVYAMDVGCRM